MNSPAVRRPSLVIALAVQPCWVVALDRWGHRVTRARPIRRHVNTRTGCRPRWAVRAVGEPAGLWIRVLGPLQVCVDGRVVPLRGAKQRRLMAALVAMPNRVVSSDRLVDMLTTVDGYLQASHRTTPQRRGMTSTRRCTAYTHKCSRCASPPPGRSSWTSRPPRPALWNSFSDNEASSSPPARHTRSYRSARFWITASAAE